MRRSRFTVCAELIIEHPGLACYWDAEKRVYCVTLFRRVGDRSVVVHGADCSSAQALRRSLPALFAELDVKCVEASQLPLL